MLQFLRTLIGCSQREAAYAENFERERAARADVRREIDESVRQIEAAAERASAAARMMARLREDMR